MYPDKPTLLENESKDQSFLATPELRFGPAGQFLALGWVGLVGMIALISALTGDLSPVPVAVGTGVFVLGMVCAFLGFLRTYPHAAVGLCNAVTVARLSAVAALVALLVQPPGNPWAIFAIAAVAFALDGIDGWLARREGLVSDFGARFDMEVDSALALVLAIHAFVAGAVGPLVLALALPRYAFFAAQAVFPWMTADLPPRFTRKVVCVLQIGTLMIMLTPFASQPLSDILVLVTLGIVGWSFWRDIVWLRHTHG